MGISRYRCHIKNGGCCRYAGIGDTHNSLRFAAGLLSGGIGNIGLCSDGFLNFHAVRKSVTDF